MDKLNKIFHILKELGIKKFYLIIFLMTLATIFEFLGISLIVPFLAILTEQNSNILSSRMDTNTPAEKLSKQNTRIYKFYQIKFDHGK